uniref:Uncharacterized protein n=1 Tax=Denticeps clupeoides TaxID=299321 RepID=A0AAY4C1X3_9TELE
KLVRIWHQHYESMDPPCLVSTAQAGGGGVMVWGTFSWHTLAYLSYLVESMLRRTKAVLKAEVGPTRY